MCIWSKGLYPSLIALIIPHRRRHPVYNNVCSFLPLAGGSVILLKLPG